MQGIPLIGESGVCEVVHFPTLQCTLHSTANFHLEEILDKLETIPFLDIYLPEAVDDEPRNNSPRKTKAQTSSKKKILEKDGEPEEKPKSKSHGIKLNNNSIGDLGTLRTTVETLFENPEGVYLVDLSFNEVATVDHVSLYSESIRTLSTSMDFKM